MNKLDSLLSAEKDSDEYKKLYKEISRKLVDRQTGSIKEILTLWKNGRTRAEIVAEGFKRSTVYRQVKEYETKSTTAIKFRQEQDSLEEAEE